MNSNYAHRIIELIVTSSAERYGLDWKTVVASAESPPGLWKRAFDTCCALLCRYLNDSVAAEIMKCTEEYARKSASFALQTNNQDFMELCNFVDKEMKEHGYDV